MAAWAFLGIGGLGVLLLALTLVGADLVGGAGIDADGTGMLETGAGCLGGFGFAAAIVCSLDGGGFTGLLIAIGVGVVAALGAALFTSWLLRRMRRLPTDATPTRADLVGTRGVVVTPVRPDRYGEVRVRMAGQQIKLSARADVELPLGATIVVVAALSDTSVVVSPVSSDA